MKKMYIFILLIFFFIGGALLGKYFTTTPSKALYITHLLEGETTIEQIHLLDTDKTRGNLIDEYIFGLINSEKKLNITLPDEEPQYLLKLSSATEETISAPTRRISYFFEKQYLKCGTNSRTPPYPYSSSRSFVRWECTMTLLIRSEYIFLKRRFKSALSSTFCAIAS